MPQRFPPPSCPTPAEWPLAPSCRPAVPPRHWQPRARRANSVKQRMRHQPIESRLSCLGPNCIAISALPSSPNIGFGSKPRVTPPSARGQRKAGPKVSGRNQPPGQGKRIPRGGMASNGQESDWVPEKLRPQIPKEQEIDFPAHHGASDGSHFPYRPQAGPALYRRLSRGPSQSGF